MSERVDVAIIGAGAAGLGAAHRLGEEGIRTLLIESEAHPGGRAYSAERDGFHIDTGAGFLASFYRNTLQIAEEIGLKDQLVTISGRGTAILRNGRPVRLSRGLLVPDDRLLPFRSRLRMARLLVPLLRHWRRLDPHDFAAAQPADLRSIADYALSELDSLVLERLLQPALDAIFYWRPEETSQALLFLLLKMAVGLERLTLLEGVGQLTTTMARREDVRYSSRVTRVEFEDKGVVLSISDPDGAAKLHASHVICTLPAPLVGPLMPFLNDEQRRFFGSIDYSMTVIAALGIRCTVELPFQSLLIPREEAGNRFLTSVTRMGAKNPAQIPDGSELLRLYASGERAGDLIELGDAEIADLLIADLRRIRLPINLDEDLLFVSVQRWRHALPKFDVGHLHKLARFQRGGLEPDRIYFAGDYLGGPFIEGALTSGIEAAERVLAAM